MTQKLRNLLKLADTWPESDQDELVALAAEIESRRTEVFVLDESEWADHQEGITLADREEAVSDEIC